MHATLIVALLSAALGFLLGRASFIDDTARADRRLSSDCDCDELRWRLAWQRLRQWRVPGPIRLSRCLQPEDLKLYGKTKPGYFEVREDGRHRNTVNQVPHVARKFMRYVGLDNTSKPKADQGHYEPYWSSQLVDALVAQAEKNTTWACPDDYPYAAVQFYQALQKHGVRGRRVLVAGSISPWLEAIGISRGASSVTTVDYSPPRTDSQRILVKTMAQLAEGGGGRHAYDAVFSYSSVEHDGLGRYGDPINPFGDSAALGEFNLLLRRDEHSLLFLGLPVGNEGLAGQGLRIYDETRFKRLTRGWELLDTYSAHPSCICGNIPSHRIKNGSPYCCPANLTFAQRVVLWEGGAFFQLSDGFGKDHWANQPLFVLRRVRA